MGALMAYHIVLGVIATYLLLAIWPAALPIPATRTIDLLFGRVSFNLGVELTLLLVVVFASLLGGFVHSVGSLAFHRAFGDLEARWTTWYLMNPFLAVGLALALYFALRAGLLTLGTEAATINIYGVAALAAIIGMFTYRGTLKARDLADALLHTVQEPKPPRAPTPGVPQSSAAAEGLGLAAAVEGAGAETSPTVVAAMPPPTEESAPGMGEIAPGPEGQPSVTAEAPKKLADLLERLKQLEGLVAAADLAEEGEDEGG